MGSLDLHVWTRIGAMYQRAAGILPAASSPVHEEGEPTLSRSTGFQWHEVLLIPILVLLLVATGMTATPAQAAEPAQGRGVDATASTNEAVRLVELRGRVVCLPEEMHREHKAELTAKHEHLWAIKTADGRGHLILRGRFSESIWLDERVRAKELVVRARLFPKTQAIEVQGIKSVRAGVVQDLYYYCDVCAIKSVSPEVCACCQAPVELVEKPLSERDE